MMSLSLRICIRIPNHLLSTMMTTTGTTCLVLLLPCFSTSFHLHPIQRRASLFTLETLSLNGKACSYPPSSSARFALEMDATVAATSVQPLTSAAGLQTVLSAAGAAIDSFFQTSPYLSAFLTCSFKATAADYVAQTQSSDDNSEMENTCDDEEATNSLDYQRTLAFLVYGGIYQGLFQELLYSGIFPAIFGVDPTWKGVGTQVSLDMFLIGPFICLPVAYIVKSAFMADELNMTTIQSTFEKYMQDVSQRGLLFKFWGVWIPVQSLTFSVIPRHFRVAFIAFVSFFWMYILSKTSAATSAETSDNISDKTTYV
jgi:hypothetical protein